MKLYEVASINNPKYLEIPRKRNNEEMEMEEEVKEISQRKRPKVKAGRRIKLTIFTKSMIVSFGQVILYLPITKCVNYLMYLIYFNLYLPVIDYTKMVSWGLTDPHRFSFY